MAYAHIPKPGEPIHLSEFFLEDRRFPAVYFLIDAGKIVYVGQSKTLKWRIETHLTEGKKVFDSVSFVRCTIDRLFEIETFYIRRIVPKYNDCGVAKSVRAREPWRFRKSAGKRMLSQDDAAAFLGLTAEELRSLPTRVTGGRKMRRPRSPVKRWAYPRDSLEYALTHHSGLIAKAKTRRL